MTEPVTKLPVNKSQVQMGVPSPIHPFEQLHQQIDRLFNDFGRGLWSTSPRGATFNIQPTWRSDFSWSSLPAVDVVENEKAFEISAELPGLEKNDVEVILSENVLTINGEKKEEKEENNQGYYVSERRYGSFTRSFRLPEGANADKIEAHFKNGVLRVTVPKNVEAQTPQKKIAIKAA